MSNEILDTYVYETNTLLEQLENIILEAEKADTFSQDDVNEIFRIMHTIKGSSAMMEFNTMMTVAHRIEDLFFIIRENTMSVVSEADRPALFDLVFQSIDYFRGEIEKVEAGQPLNMDIDSFLSNINRLIDKIKGGGQDSEKPQAAAPAAESAAPANGGQSAKAESADNGDALRGNNPEYPHELLITFDEGCGMENLRAFMLVTSVRDACGESAFLFEPADVETDTATAEAIIEHGFLMLFKHPEDREKAIALLKSTGATKDYQTHDYQPPKEEHKEAPKAAPKEEPKAAAPAKSGGAAAPAAPAQSGQQTQHPKESLISVSLSKLDQLMAVVGEIVITESMVTSSPNLKGLNLDAFTKSARQLRKLTDELQDVSMSLRMVPVSATFQKMNRIVRDMSKKLNKQVKLTLVGENTEVDKTIVDSIGDPIMHMVRNSVDHGIEDNVEDRIAAGKDPVGEVVLSARDTGSEVIIEIKDDGQGVNYDAVLKKAIKNGIASPDVEYSNREILNFLMAPGFSTNTQVTEYSGRGVGMDVVKHGVEELGGTLTISSEPGKGMTNVMRIPLTMAIMDGMEVSVGNSIFTIPINNIRQSFKVTAQDVIYDSTNGEMIKCMDHFYPVIRAKDLYHLEQGVTDIEEGILLWLESGDCSYCLFVDELLGEQQVVVKQLPGYVNSYNIKDYGINGCTLLGDGSISIILDVANIYSAKHIKA
jgi:two-component system chemotaxis sensor kinase CheA